MNYDTPDALHALDLQIFAASSGMSLNKMSHDWRASLLVGDTIYCAYGSRPWIATKELYLRVCHLDSTQSQ